MRLGGLQVAVLLERSVVPLERGHPMGCLRGWSSPETRTMCHGGRKRPPDSRLWFGRGASSVITRYAPTLGALPPLQSARKSLILLGQRLMGYLTMPPELPQSHRAARVGAEGTLPVALFRRGDIHYAY